MATKAFQLEKLQKQLNINNIWKYEILSDI